MQTLKDGQNQQNEGKTRQTVRTVEKKSAGNKLILDKTLTVSNPATTRRVHLRYSAQQHPEHLVTVSGSNARSKFVFILHISFMTERSDRQNA